MARKEKFTIKQVSDAIKKGQGFVSAAADILICEPQTVRNYINKYDKCKLATEEAQGKTLDYVESRLMSLVKDKNVTAIIFYLKTKGKNRGYVERQEVTGPDGGNIKFVVKFK